LGVRIDFFENSYLRQDTFVGGNMLPAVLILVVVCQDSDSRRPLERHHGTKMAEWDQQSDHEKECAPFGDTESMEMSRQGPREAHGSVLVAAALGRDDAGANHGHVALPPLHTE
jgi:hypothetical protein